MPRAADVPLWRLSVKSTAPYTDLGGEQLIEWGGALRWLAPANARDASACALGRRARRPRDAVPRDRQEQRACSSR